MSKAEGTVTGVYIDQTAARFALCKPGHTLQEFILYNDAPETHTIPQLELARRSWMLSLLQHAYVSNLTVDIAYSSDQIVTSMALMYYAFPLHGGKAQHPNANPAQKPNIPGVLHP